MQKQTLSHIPNIIHKSSADGVGHHQLMSRCIANCACKLTMLTTTMNWRTMGFYWSYTLLHKLSLLMHSCSVYVNN